MEAEWQTTEGSRKLDVLAGENRGRLADYRLGVGQELVASTKHPAGAETAQRGLRFRWEELILAFVPINAKSRRPLSETTPQDRLERLVQLQRQAWELLIASPNGYQHFWQRNLRQRRIHAQH